MAPWSKYRGEGAIVGCVCQPGLAAGLYLIMEKRIARMQWSSWRPRGDLTWSDHCRLTSGPQMAFERSNGPRMCIESSQLSLYTTILLRTQPFGDRISNSRSAVACIIAWVPDQSRETVPVVQQLTTHCRAVELNRGVG
jgi:hypothetical protein